MFSPFWANDRTVYHIKWEVIVSDLLETFQNITIGDDDKLSYLGQKEWLKKNLKDHKRKRLKIIELFVLNKEKEEGRKNVEACVK